LVDWSILFIQVCRTIEKELGESMNDLFSDFVKTPLATASVGSSDSCWLSALYMNSGLRSSIIDFFSSFEGVASLSRFWDNLIIYIFYSVQIAQVHRATLLNGQEVVVKVQHEGIKRIILEVLHALAFEILG
jgi:aarF domain-containing kinase